MASLLIRQHCLNLLQIAIGVGQAGAFRRRDADPGDTTVIGRREFRG